jgi:hypothetical protein
MNDVERKAEFYAKVASIADLEALPLVDKSQLTLDAVKAGLLSPAFLPGVVFDPGPGFPAPKKRKRSKPDNSLAWFFIKGIHPWARKIISSLVDHGKVDPAITLELDKAARENHWQPEGWDLDKATRRLIPRPTQDGVMYAGLMEVIDPFPFDRCPQCKNFFVPGKNQKYCSKTCSTKALQPWKRKYMKTYMADKRKTEAKRR